MSRRNQPPTGVDAVARVTARLEASAKYREIHPHTVAQIVHREQAGSRDPVELERLSRARLHKVAALHLLTERPGTLRNAVRDTDLADPRSRLALCRQVLAAHASSAERLSDLDRFYPTVLALVPAPATIVDLACALNPFTLPWLRRESEAVYTGYDLNSTFVNLANAFLQGCYPQSSVTHRDVITDPIPGRPDLALLLKTYHCIEGRRLGAGLNLVRELDAANVVVSFPTRAMNGRAALFAEPQIAQLSELARAKGWRFARAGLPTEHLVLVQKG
jgi:16S rRNA (guanine(1405)-N(7))-methyltransferase